jgi:hypothetical protein
VTIPGVRQHFLDRLTGPRLRSGIEFEGRSSRPSTLLDSEHLADRRRSVAPTVISGPQLEASL